MDTSQKEDNVKLQVNKKLFSQYQAFHFVLRYRIQFKTSTVCWNADFFFNKWQKELRPPLLLDQLSTSTLITSSLEKLSQLEQKQEEVVFIYNNISWQDFIYFLQLKKIFLRVLVTFFRQAFSDCFESIRILITFILEGKIRTYTTLLSCQWSTPSKSVNRRQNCLPKTNQRIISQISNFLRKSKLQCFSRLPKTSAVFASSLSHSPIST